MASAINRPIILVVLVVLVACASRSLRPVAINVEGDTWETGSYLATVEMSSTSAPKTDGTYSYTDISFVIENRRGVPIYFKMEDIQLVAQNGQRALVRSSASADVSGITVFRVRPAGKLRLAITVTAAGTTSALSFQGVDLGDKKKQSAYAGTYDLFSRHGEEAAR